MATNDMDMKFQTEIPKQTWVMLRKPCRLQTDRQTYGKGDSSIPPPPTSLGGGIMTYIYMNHSENIDTGNEMRNP